MHAARKQAKPTRLVRLQKPAHEISAPVAPEKENQSEPGRMQRADDALLREALGPVLDVARADLLELVPLRLALERGKAVASDALVSGAAAARETSGNARTQR